MPKYCVTIEYKSYIAYEVEADTAEEAGQQALTEEMTGDEIEVDFSSGIVAHVEDEAAWNLVDTWYACLSEDEAESLRTLVAPHLKPGLVAGPVTWRNAQWGFQVQGRYQP